MKYIKMFENYQGNSDLALVSDSEAQSIIVRAHRNKAQDGRSGKPIMLLGAPGRGKTSVIKAAADEAGGEIIMLELPYMDPSDFMGVPMFNYSRKMQIPSWFPMKGSGIIVLDSLNRASLQIQAEATKLAVNGESGGNKLPQGWLVVATADSTDMLSNALLDEFTILNLE